MMGWSKRFPSKYLTVEDINAAGGEVRGAVTEVREETMQDLEHPGTEVRKAILVLDGGAKPIVPGKIMSKVLAVAYGDDPLACVGKTVIAFPFLHKGKQIVMLRCLVNGQDSGAKPAAGGADPAKLAEMQAQLDKANAALAAAKKPAKKGRK